MRRVVWADPARLAVIGIQRHLAQFNPKAAAEVAAELIAAGDSLADFPDRGRLVRGNRRELVSVQPYVIRYRVQADTVRILRVRHGARRPEV